METRKCLCCKAPCVTETTEAKRVPFINESGSLDYTHHPAFTKFRYIGHEASVDDLILLQGLEEIRDEFKIDYRSAGGFGHSTADRRNYRKLENMNLAIKRLKELLSIK